MESITRRRERAEEYYVALMAYASESKNPEDQAAATEAGIRFKELQYQEAVEYQQAVLAIVERNRRTTPVAALVAAPVAAPVPAPTPIQTATSVDQASTDKAAVDRVSCNTNSSTNSS